MNQSQQSHSPSIAASCEGWVLKAVALAETFAKK